MSVGPFAQGGLDEALGLAVGFRSVEAGEAVPEAEGGDLGGHGAGAVGGTVVRVDALDADAEFFEEGQGGVEEGDDTACGFIREELCEGDARVVVDGDVEVFPACAAGVIALAVTGDAVARAHDASEFLDVEMEEVARMLALVADDGRRRREREQTCGVTVQEARHGSLGELGRASDLEARQPAAAQSQDACDAQRVGGFGGTFWARRAIGKAGGALGAEASQPLVGAALGEAEARRHLRDRLVEIDDATDHLRSTQRGEFGLTVRVHAALVLGLVLISQPHLSKSSPHEQPIGTSHLGNLGNAHFSLGDARKAMDYHEQALVVSREIGDRRGEGNALFNSALAHDSLGNCPEAIARAAAALEIFEAIEDPNAAKVRATLAEWRAT